MTAKATLASVVSLHARLRRAREDRNRANRTIRQCWRRLDEIALKATAKPNRKG